MMLRYSLVFAIGLIIGLIGTVNAGYWVHDSNSTEYSNQPVCPPGFDSEYFGVVYNNGAWAPIYQCTYIGIPVTPTQIEVTQLTSQKINETQPTQQSSISPSMSVKP